MKVTLKLDEGPLRAWSGVFIRYFKSSVRFPIIITTMSRFRDWRLLCIINIIDTDPCVGTWLYHNIDKPSTRWVVRVTPHFILRSSSFNWKGCPMVIVYRDLGGP